MITELTLENFRGFRSLELKGLKRVNLIVGHNNTGKTSVLESILMMCQPARLTELPGMFRAIQGDAHLRYFPWLLRDGADQQVGFVKCLSSYGSQELLFGKSLAGPKDSQQIYGTTTFRIFQVQQRDPQFPARPLGPAEDPTLPAYRPPPQLPCRIIPIQHRDAVSLVKLVGNALRKKAGEETIQRLLAVVDPKIRKVRVDPAEDGTQVIIDIGLSELVPVSQLGQGIYRLLTILADLIGDIPKVVLIDEVENGLHHSVHEQVWKGLAEIAAELDVQVFATTHSNECLHAAHRAFSKRKEYDFGVIQLFRVETGVQGRLLDQKHIEAALAGEIELRD